VNQQAWNSHVQRSVPAAEVRSFDHSEPKILFVKIIANLCIMHEVNKAA
jgi:hypothetical protein